MGGGVGVVSVWVGGLEEVLEALVVITGGGDVIGEGGVEGVAEDASSESEQWVEPVIALVYVDSFVTDLAVVFGAMETIVTVISVGVYCHPLCQDCFRMLDEGLYQLLICWDYQHCDWWG